VRSRLDGDIGEIGVDIERDQIYVFQKAWIDLGVEEGY
jgi:hypothetical protein